MARDRKNYSYLISILKIISPVLFALFILIANIISKSDLQKGSFKILNDNEYIASFISDTAKAEKSIICALFMYKIDNYNINNLEEPVPLITSAFINAAKRNVNVTIIFEKSSDKDDLSNKYNTNTAAYLEKYGIKVLFDNESKKLHAKLCLIDDKIIYTGSHNFTYSAMKRNSENSVRIVSYDEAEKIKEYFTKIQE